LNLKLNSVIIDAVVVMETFAHLHAVAYLPLATWAMPPPLGSEKFLHMAKNATLEKFDSQENS